MNEEVLKVFAKYLSDIDRLERMLMAGAITETEWIARKLLAASGAERDFANLLD